MGNGVGTYNDLRELVALGASGAVGVALAPIHLMRSP